MIGRLLKQLFAALGGYVRYHTRRILGLPQNPQSPAPSGSFDYTAVFTATEASISGLSDEGGINPDYERRVSWPCYRLDVPSEEVVSDALYQLWTNFPSGHKWTHYFPIYESVFGPIRTKPLRILEIGLWQGASLKLWRQYFEHPGTIIVGVDILPQCMRFDAPATGVHVRIGSQADPVFLKRVVEEFGPFDLIMDDGSHHSSHIIASFNHLYGDGLAEDGIYFVEDLHANYWHPWRDTRKSFLDICKELLEHMHAHYRCASPPEFLIDKQSTRDIVAMDVPQITTMIREMRFFDSIVAIYKTRRAYVPYFVSVRE
jgi:SAM-dependent methyltransferase